MLKSIKLLLVFTVIVALLAGCSPKEPVVEEATTPQETDSLVVYSSRNETFVQALLDKFEAETGIKVLALHAGDAVVNKIVEEAKNVQADIFISNDVGGMEHLRMEGLLQGVQPDGIQTIDGIYRAEDNAWFALSARTRVLMYNKDLITEEEMPKTIWELTDSKWKGKFAITRGGNAGLISHVSALRQEWGDEKTLEWLSIVKDNAGAITQGHGDIRKAVGSGEFVFGLVNNYYYHQQLREPENNNVGVIYPDQGEGEMGAVVNAAGVAFIKGAPNEINAVTFLEWILKPENQREFSYASLEIPINPNIEAIGEAARISDYKVHNMPLRALGEVWTDTRQLIEQSGLDLELK
jgi:iron(III) transport system substrate-binding protein